MCVFLYFAESNGWCTWWWETSFPKGTAFRLTFSNKKTALKGVKSALFLEGHCCNGFKRKYKVSLTRLPLRHTRNSVHGVKARMLVLIQSRCSAVGSPTRLPSTLIHEHSSFLLCLLQLLFSSRQLIICLHRKTFIISSISGITQFMTLYDSYHRHRYIEISVHISVSFCCLIFLLMDNIPYGRVINVKNKLVYPKK